MTPKAVFLQLSLRSLVLGCLVVFHVQASAQTTKPVNQRPAASAPVASKTTRPKPPWAALTPMQQPTPTPLPSNRVTSPAATNPTGLRILQNHQTPPPQGPPAPNPPANLLSGPGTRPTATSVGGGPPPGSGGPWSCPSRGRCTRRTPHRRAGPSLNRPRNARAVSRLPPRARSRGRPTTSAGCARQLPR